MFGISKNRLLRIFNQIKNDMSDPFYQNIAPGLAYYFLLSLVPIVMLLGQLSGLFSFSMEYLVNFVDTYAPEELADFILPLLSSQISRGSLIANIIFFVTTLYLASRAMYALIRISDYAYEIPPPEIRYFLILLFIKQHLKAIIMTFLMLFIIIFSLLMIVFGGVIIDFLLSIFNAHEYLLYIEGLLDYLALPLSFCVLFVVLLIIYWGMPSKRIHVKLVIPGTVFSTVGIVIVSFLYMIYVKYFCNYNIVYGTLSSIAFLLLWFFIIGYVLELGIVINSAVEKNKR